MKYIKTYEDEKLQEYSGKIYISIPSLSSEVLIIFVESIYKKVVWSYTSPSDNYEIKGTCVRFKGTLNSLKFSRIESWEQEYLRRGFDRINFITIKLLYKNYNKLFMDLLESLLEQKKRKNLQERYIKILDYLISRLTIPETEHIIDAQKYNL